MNVVLRIQLCCSVLLFAALALFVSGCGDQEEALPVDMAKREEVEAPTVHAGLTYAYLPQYSHTVSYRRHRLIVDYLSEATGYTVRQVFPDTFDKHVEMVNSGEIDISFSNPFVYIQLAEKGARAFARVVESRGEADFWGQIICRHDNEAIQTVPDVRGKSWIAVDPGSAGGYLFALGFFQRHGLTADDFSQVAFAPGPGGKQEKVVLAVFAGKYDIGSIRTGTLSIVKDIIDLSQIRVLAETRRYPGWVYSARRGLSPTVVEDVANALFALNENTPAHKLVLEAAAFNGIISAQDSDYDPVRKLTNDLGLQ